MSGWHVVKLNGEHNTRFFEKDQALKLEKMKKILRAHFQYNTSPDF
jgi:hypothetical protein